MAGQTHPVIDLPDDATFAAALSEQRLVMAMAVAALAGLVRGFSGFGGAMIYMPLVAALYDPLRECSAVVHVRIEGQAPTAEIIADFTSEEGEDVRVHELRVRALAKGNFEVHASTANDTLWVRPRA